MNIKCLKYCNDIKYKTSPKLVQENVLLEGCLRPNFGGGGGGGGKKISFRMAYLVGRRGEGLW